MSRSLCGQPRSSRPGTRRWREPANRAAAPECGRPSRGELRTLRPWLRSGALSGRPRPPRVDARLSPTRRVPGAAREPGPWPRPADYRFRLRAGLRPARAGWVGATASGRADSRAESWPFPIFHNRSGSAEYSRLPGPSRSWSVRSRPADRGVPAPPASAAYREKIRAGWSLPQSRPATVRGGRAGFLRVPAPVRRYPAGSGPRSRQCRKPGRARAQRDAGCHVSAGSGSR